MIVEGELLQERNPEVEVEHGMEPGVYPLLRILEEMRETI